MRKRSIEVAVCSLKNWRLIPWYESDTCQHGCCVLRSFTWVFLRIVYIRTVS